LRASSLQFETLFSLEAGASLAGYIPRARQ
jgi:hypothetical protein